MKNSLTEQVIINFQKRFAMDKTEAKQNGIFGEDRKAMIKRIGKKVTIFITDTTFSEFDELTQIGKYNDNMLLAQRIEDDYGFETPYVMHLSFTNGKKYIIYLG